MQNMTSVQAYWEMFKYITSFQMRKQHRILFTALSLKYNYVVWEKYLNALNRLKHEAAGCIQVDSVET